MSRPIQSLFTSSPLSPDKLILTYFHDPFNNILSFLCLHRSISCRVLYNLGVLCGCIRDGDGSASYTAFINRNGLRRGFTSLPVPADTHQCGKHTGCHVWGLSFCTDSFPLFLNIPLLSSPITFPSFDIQFGLLCSFPPCRLIMDIMHFSNQLCRDWTEMIWLDRMRIADPVVKLNSFYLIHSLSDLQVELSTNQNPLTVACRQPESNSIKFHKKPRVS